MFLVSFICSFFNVIHMSQQATALQSSHFVEFPVENKGFHSCFSHSSWLLPSFSVGFSPLRFFNGFSIEEAGPGVGGTSLSGASLHTSGISCRVIDVSLLFFSLHRPLGAEGVLGALGGLCLGWFFSAW